MATLATPTTLITDQEIAIKAGLNEVQCFNDSYLTDMHYRTIPNDGSDLSKIRWANLKSVPRDSDNYAVAISMYEYIYIGSDSTDLSIAQKALNDRAFAGTLFTDTQGHSYYIQKGSVKIDSPRIGFRKIVWAKSSDLYLGTDVQQKVDNGIDPNTFPKKDTQKINTNKNKLANQQTDTQTPTKSKTLLYVSIAGGILLLAGLGYYFFGNKNSTPAKETITQTK